MLNLAPVLTVTATLTGAGTGAVLFSPEFSITLEVSGAGAGELVFQEADYELSLVVAPLIAGAPGSGGGEVESGPQLTWLGGLVQRIDYLSGNYKLLFYALGRLAYIDYVKPLQTIRSTIVYNLDGTVARVDPVVL